MAWVEWDQLARPGVVIPWLILVLYLATAVYQVGKPLPKGLDVATPWRQVSDLLLLHDATWLDADGRQHTEWEIFDEIFRLIRQAERLVVLDMFLVNEFAGDVDEGHRPLARELVDALIARRRERPDLQAVLITDPFNSLYGSLEPDLFRDLEAAGVRVIETDLRALRDPNPTWSAFWRLCCQWFGNSPDRAWLPDPVGAGRTTLRAYLDLFNLKANHRKTLVVDVGDNWAGMVTSANPHDASSLHSNQAIRFHGPAALDLLETELAVARMSGAGDAFTVPGYTTGSDVEDGLELRVVTESRIREAALSMIDAAGPGDRLDLRMFYLSHRAVVRALIDARDRGAAVRVLLDPNKGAFGRRRNGIPNRQVAMELRRGDVAVRWCNTRGEQCHGKWLLRVGADGRGELLTGSSNFTRRNLDNYNLETNVHLRGDADAPALQAAASVFDARWENEPGRIHSVSYDVYADHARWRYAVYRIMEATGLSTF